MGIVDFFNRNKAKIGGSLGAVVTAAAALHVGPPWLQIGLGLLSTALVGGGVTESDATHKENQKWENR